MLVWQAHKARIRHMAFSPDGMQLATTTGNSKFVWLWNATSGTPAGRLAGHDTYARAVAYSPDGRFIASTQNIPPVQVWDRATSASLAVLSLPGWGSDSLAFRPDSSALAVSTNYRGVQEFSTSTFGRSFGTLGATRRLAPKYDYCVRVQFSPTGKYMGGVTNRKDLHVLDAGGEELVRTFHDRDGAGASVFAFAPDDSAIAIVFGLRILVWRLPNTGDKPVTLRGHASYIHAIGFMPGGEVVSAGADGRVRVWDAATGGEVRSFDWGIGKVCAAAVSPDGMLCAAGSSSGKIVVWDVDA